MTGQRRTPWGSVSRAAFWGDRAGGAISTIDRTIDDTSTAWAATTTGRLFVTKNVAADPASAVSWTRLDDDVANDPSRFISSIHIDSENGNRAWISYSGYGANTPGFPAHVFQVVYNPGTGTSTWTDLSFNFGDLPVNDLVRDDPTGDLYAATDFGVLRLAAGTSTLGERRAGASERRGGEPRDRRGQADPLCRDARPQHLEAEPRLTPRSTA